MNMRDIWPHPMRLFETTYISLLSGVEPSISSRTIALILWRRDHLRIKSTIEVHCGEGLFTWADPWMCISLSSYRFHLVLTVCRIHCRLTGWLSSVFHAAGRTVPMINNWRYLRLAHLPRDGFSRACYIFLVNESLFVAWRDALLLNFVFHLFLYLSLYRRKSRIPIVLKYLWMFVFHSDLDYYFCNII